MTAPVRITPACAGKSFSPTSFYKRRKDHPRVCGEKFCAITWRSTEIGSPPRVRGKGTFHSSSVSRDRITPACAGKSYAVTGKKKLRRDHPRVCGEKSSRQRFLM